MFFNDATLRNSSSPNFPPSFPKPSPKDSLTGHLEIPKLAAQHTQLTSRTRVAKKRSSVTFHANRLTDFAKPSHATAMAQPHPLNNNLLPPRSSCQSFASHIAKTQKFREPANAARATPEQPCIPTHITAWLPPSAPHCIPFTTYHHSECFPALHRGPAPPLHPLSHLSAVRSALSSPSVVTSPNML